MRLSHALVVGVMEEYRSARNDGDRNLESSLEYVAKLQSVNVVNCFIIRSMMGHLIRDKIIVNFVRADNSCQLLDNIKIRIIRFGDLVFKSSLVIIKKKIIY